MQIFINIRVARTYRHINMVFVFMPMYALAMRKYGESVLNAFEFYCNHNW